MLQGIELGAVVVRAHYIPTNVTGDYRYRRYQSVIMAEMSDGTLEDVLVWYADEISFTTEEVIGLTSSECGRLFHKRDVAYLQS